MNSIASYVASPDNLIALETAALAVFTLVLAYYTAGLYLQTKRANRPHVSVELALAHEVGACVISIENHGPGVATEIRVSLGSDYKSGNQLALATDDSRLKIEFLKPGGIRSIRIPGVEGLSPNQNTAKIEYCDVFKQRHEGTFELILASLGEPDHRFDERNLQFHAIVNSAEHIAGKLEGISRKIEDLGGEVRRASHTFRNREL